jgi:hypothetical protein
MPTAALLDTTLPRTSKSGSDDNAVPAEVLAVFLEKYPPVSRLKFVLEPYYLFFPIIIFHLCLHFQFVLEPLSLLFFTFGSNPCTNLLFYVPNFGSSRTAQDS